MVNTHGIPVLYKSTGGGQESTLRLLGTNGGGSSVGLEHGTRWWVWPHLEKWTAGCHISPSASLIFLWQPRWPCTSVGNKTINIITFPPAITVTFVTITNITKEHKNYRSPLLVCTSVNAFPALCALTLFPVLVPCEKFPTICTLGDRNPLRIKYMNLLKKNFHQKTIT